MMDERDSDDVDRAAILARRRRFILAALGGLAGAGACARAEPAPAGPPAEFKTFNGLVGTPHRLTSFDDPPPEPLAPEPLAPEPPMSFEELTAILEDPSLDLCVENPVAKYNFHLHDDHAAAVAMAFYSRGLRAQEEGDLVCALAMFEFAYFQIPGKHWLAFITGEAAYAVGDCGKALEYLEHYLRYADHGKKPEWEARTKELLSTPELLACERPPPEYDAEPQVCLELPFEPEPEPLVEEPRPRSGEQKRASKMFRPRQRR